MKIIINCIVLFGLLFPATLALAEKGKWTSDVSIVKQPQIILEPLDDCEENDAYCYRGEYYTCRNGQWIMAENCKANNKMCHPYEAKCIECVIAENTTPETASSVEYHEKYYGILCTGSCEAWFKVEVPAGKTLFVEVYWEGGEGGGVYMDMFNSNATESIAMVDEGMEITYTNTGETATFFLKVYNVDDWQSFSGYAFTARPQD